MGQAIAFDTHAYVKKLQSVGFTEEQAEVLSSTQAELIDERLATKRDLKEIESKLEAKIVESKLETIKWVAGMLIGQALLIIGVLKFF